MVRASRVSRHRETEGPVVDLAASAVISEGMGCSRSGRRVKRAARARSSRLRRASAKLRGLTRTILLVGR